MADKSKPRPDAAEQPDETHEKAILDFLRSEALTWLSHPNVAGVMLGKKHVKGEEQESDAVIFRVRRKLADRQDILTVGSKPIPAEIEIGGRRYPTDVIEGSHRASDGHGGDVDRRRRFPFICPGVSIGNAGVPGDAGTGTAIVRHRQTGQLALLSCDHVLGRRDGNRKATQPGRADNGRPEDVFGDVLTGIRGIDGDAAIATIVGRPADARIPGLDVAIRQLGAARRGNLVVKAGRTTGISYGVVRSDAAVMLVEYKDSADKEVQGIEIAPLDGEMTEEGDSGAPWMLADPATRRPTGILVGIHTSSTADRTGSFACLPATVFEKLGIELAAAADLAAPPPPLAGGNLALHAAGADTLRVTARRGLVLRAGAGREFGSLATLPLGTLVSRLGTSGDWTQVDLAGDGAADGFVYSPFLAPVGG